MSNYHVICVAGGVGQRFSSTIPKPFIELNQYPLWYYSLKLFSQISKIQQTVLVIDQHYPAFIEQSKTFETFNCQLASPGETRMHSVIHGMHALSKTAAADDWVLIHDVARPCLTTTAVNRLIETVGQHQVGGILACPVVDTIKHVVEKTIQKTVARENLYVAQTPQMFRFQLLKKALNHALQQKNCSDEAQAIEQLGKRPLMVLGERDNIKLTTPDDYACLQKLLFKTIN